MSSQRNVVTASQLVQGAPNLEEGADEGGLRVLALRHVQSSASDGAVEEESPRSSQLLSHSRGHGESVRSQNPGRFCGVAVVGCLPQSLDDAKGEHGVGAPLRRGELELVGTVEAERS